MSLGRSCIFLILLPLGGACSRGGFGSLYFGKTAGEVKSLSTLNSAAALGVAAAGGNVIVDPALDTELVPTASTPAGVLGGDVARLAAELDLHDAARVDQRGKPGLELGGIFGARGQRLERLVAEQIGRAHV